MTLIMPSLVICCPPERYSIGYMSSSRWLNSAAT